jgi:effector-binding domain-containing protein
MPDGEVEIDVCMPMAPGATGGDAVELVDLPEVEAASLLHRGHYDEMAPAWNHLMAWVGSSGRPPSGPMREVYLNDPDRVAPEDLLTELLVPFA